MTHAPETVAGIVLAAGSSSRMGRNTLFLERDLGVPDDDDPVRAQLAAR